jgi:hypothetical protein
MPLGYLAHDIRQQPPALLLHERIVHFTSGLQAVAGRQYTLRVDNETRSVLCTCVLPNNRAVLCAPQPEQRGMFPFAALATGTAVDTA